MNPLPHTIRTTHSTLAPRVAAKFDEYQLASHLNAISTINDYLNGKWCKSVNIKYQMSSEARERAVRVTLPFLHQEVTRIKHKIASKQ